MPAKKKLTLVNLFKPLLDEFESVKIDVAYNTGSYKSYIVDMVGETFFVTTSCLVIPINTLAHIRITDKKHNLRFQEIIGEMK